MVTPPPGLGSTALGEGSSRGPMRVGPVMAVRVGPVQTVRATRRDADDPPPPRLRRRNRQLGPDNQANIRPDLLGGRQVPTAPTRQVRADRTGTDPELIVGSAKSVLGGDWVRPDTANPFGDGKAAERGAQAVAWLLGPADRPADFTA